MKQKFLSLAIGKSTFFNHFFNFSIKMFLVPDMFAFYQNIETPFNLPGFACLLAFGLYAYFERERKVTKEELDFRLRSTPYALKFDRKGNILEESKLWGKYDWN